MSPRIRSRVLTPIVLLLLVAAWSPGCHHGPPISTNPIGAVAYHADHVTLAMGKIEKMIMDAADSTPPLVPVASAKTALATCRIVDVNAVALADALAELEKAAGAGPMDKVFAALDAMQVALANIQVPIGNEGLRAAIAALLPEIERTLRNVLLALPKRLP